MQELIIDKEFKELIPPLTEEERKQLEQSLLKEGCRDAIVVWNGIIIDGHNRYEICKKHGIPFETLKKDFKNRTKAKVWIIHNQLGRRNLKTYEKGLMGLELKKCFEEMAKKNKQQAIKIADSYNPKKQDWFYQKSDKTKKRSVELEETEKKNSNIKDDVINQKSDKTSNPVFALKEASKEVGISHDTLYKIETIEQKAPLEIKEKIRKKKLSVNKAYKIIKQKEKQQEKQKKFEQTELIETEDFKVIYGDFREVDIETNSVDLILTDPPYPKEYLELWKPLGEFANRVLKPSKFLISYSAHIYLPKVLNDLSESLIYYWEMALIHNGHYATTFGRNMSNGWKPILVFQKPPFKKLDSIMLDIIQGSGTEKSLHKWQQASEEVRPIIEHFTVAGDTVLDCFAGSGSFGITAYKLKRKSINIEKELDSVNTIKKRFADEFR